MGALDFDPDLILARIRNRVGAPANLANPAKLPPKFSNFSSFSRPSPPSRIYDNAAHEDKTSLDDEIAERASIVEIEGDIPSAYAETFARLDAECPHDLEHDRWRGIVDDAGRFLDRWGHEAERLQWSTLDLFGSECLGAAEHRLGVIPLIDGGGVVALGRRRAVIETSRGNSIIYMRTAPDDEP